jgi:hypothetical protein
MEQNASSPVKNPDITSALESWGMGSSSSLGAPSGMGMGAGEGAGAGAGSSSRDREDDAAAVSSKMLMSTPQVRPPPGWLPSHVGVYVVPGLSVPWEGRGGGGGVHHAGLCVCVCVCVCLQRYTTPAPGFWSCSTVRTQRPRCSTATGLRAARVEPKVAPAC